MKVHTLTFVHEGYTYVQAFVRSWPYLTNTTAARSGVGQPYVPPTKKQLRRARRTVRQLLASHLREYREVWAHE